MAEVAKRFAELGRVRVEVTNPDQKDAMALHAECTSNDDALKARITTALRDVTKLGGEVLFATVGSLANDGKVIDDARQYE